MSTPNSGKPRFSPIKLVLMRELVSKTNTLRNLNSRILKASITATNGMIVRGLFSQFFFNTILFFLHVHCPSFLKIGLEPQCTGICTPPQDCYDIIYSDGHLLYRGFANNNSKCTIYI